MAAVGTVLAVSAGALFQACTRTPVAVARPNLVLIVIDALRADSLSCYGYERATSPNIDALAGRSVVFDNAVAVGGNTPTVMGAMMLGRFPFFDVSGEMDQRSKFGLTRFYQRQEEVGLPSSPPVLAELLAERGYHTVGMITNPHLKKVYHFDQGFDLYREVFNEKRAYGTAEDLTRNVTSWLNDGVEEPFFLFLHYMDVHGPYLPPKRLRQAFSYKRVKRRPDWQVYQDWVRCNELDHKRNRDIAEHMKGNYDTEILYADESIGAVLSALEDRGFLQNAVIAVTADHGDEFLEHGGTTHTGKLYEEIVKVPLIVNAAGAQPRRVGALVRNFDLMPTLLDFAGVQESPEDLDAVSLRPLVEGRVDAMNLRAFANFPFDAAGGGKRLVRMVRDDRFKLVHRPEFPGADELFDLERDPSEMVNLNSKRPQLRGRLLRELGATVAGLEAEIAGSGADTARVVLEHSSNREAEGWAPCDRRSNILSQRGAVVIRARGGTGDACGSVPVVASRLGARFLVRLDVSVDQQAELVLRHCGRDGPERSDGSAASERLKPGRRIVYSELDAASGGDTMEVLASGSPTLWIFGIEVLELGGHAESGLKTGTGTQTRPSSTSVDQGTLQQLRALGYTD